MGAHPTNDQSITTIVPTDQEDALACIPLDEFEIMPATGFYTQASMDDASLDMTGLDICSSSRAGGADKWYSVVGAGAVLTAHTCSQFFESSGFDSQLSLYTSNKLTDDIPCARDLLCVGSTDDFCGQHSLVSWYAEEGRDYFIHVHSKVFDNAGLHHQFSLTLAPTPGGSCQAAIPIRPGPLTGELEIGNDPSGMDLLQVGGFVWFLVTESTFAWPIASTCQENVTIPARMEVFQGSCVGGLQEVGAIERRNCGSGQTLAWLSAPGESYYIKLSKQDKARG